MIQKSDYRKIGFVGEGQFGKVYGAIHRDTGELVALKELNPQKISTKEFLKEIRILLRLEHVHIVCFYGIEYHAKKRYLITEYCEGGTLRDLLNTNNILSIEYQLKIIIDILDGLNYIHQEGVIHRDLKPDNILLSLTSQGWIAKISDFGIAKIAAEDLNSNLSTMGDTGSPAYMAPEQFYGKYSHSCDLYAMGIMLYEFLIGDRPFLGSPSEIMLGHLNKIPVIPENVPIYLRDIIVKALQKLPQNRFRTAEEMKMEILKGTLNLSECNQSLYIKVEHKLIDFKLIDSQYIDKNIHSLVINNKYIYQVTKKDVIIDNFFIDTNKINIHLENIQKHELNQEIIDIRLVDDGCIVITGSFTEQNKYSLFHCNNQIHNLITWQSDFLAYAIADNISWIAINKTEFIHQGLQLINLKNLIPITSLLEDFLPKQIISLNNKNGVAIYTQKDLNCQQTYFRYFNRRGNFYDTFVISLSLQKVIHHPLSQNTFLTREKQTNNLVLINCYPFSIRRLPVSFRADFYVPRNNGFICASENGCIAFLDLSGNYLGEINLDFDIIAIASIEEDKFVVIVEKEGKKMRQFYQVEPVKFISNK